MTSIVSEFHDAPSLKHLDDLSTEIFDSPRVQVKVKHDNYIRYMNLKKALQSKLLKVWRLLKCITQ